MKKAISLSASILFLMAAIMMFLIPFSGLAETDYPDAAAHEAQITANAKRLYNQVISEHGSAAGYVNYIAQQERYYRVTMTEAEYYNSAYNTSVSFCTTLAKVGVSVISKSPSDALISVGKTYYNQFLKEISKGLPKISKAEFVYGQATAGIEEISTGELWDIMDRVAANSGEFVSVEDAVNFIVDYQNNRACFVSAELGRAYYYDQLNQGPWDTLGEIGVNIFISEVSKKICPYETYWEVDYLKGYAVTQMKNYVELIATQLENPHITQWKEDLEAIEAETERMLSYIPTSGSSYLPTLPAHTVTYDPNGGRVGVSQYIVYEGAAYGYMPTPFWFGYEFLGWFDAPEGGTAYTTSSVYPLNSDQTLYAHWEREKLLQGSCGDNLTYVLYGDGLLEIVGGGEMTSAPWEGLIYTEQPNRYSERIGQVSLPEGLTVICESAFKDCKYLCNIEIPSTVIKIGNEAFRYTRISELYLPHGVVDLGSGITDDTLLKKIFYPNTLINAKGQGLNENVEIVFEEGFGLVPDYMFDALAIDELTLPDTVTEIGNYAFARSKISKLTMPKKLKKLGYGIFKYNENLKELTLPGTVAEMEHSYSTAGNTYIGTFTDSAIETVILEEGITELGDYAFYKCDHLKSVQLPKSLERIGEATFRFCSSLQSLTIPRSVTSIGWHQWCPTMYVYRDSIGEEYAKFHNHDYAYIKDDEDVPDCTLPGSLREVEEEAFEETNFSYIIVPDSVTTIKRNAFKDCRNLKIIVIPKSVEIIAEDAFEGVEKLSVYTEIGSAADSLAKELGYSVFYE